jgi:hypothetical protein
MSYSVCSFLALASVVTALGRDAKTARFFDIKALSEVEHRADRYLHIPIAGLCYDHYQGEGMTSPLPPW